MAELSLEQLLELAVQQHQAGELPEAERLYRLVLTQYPDQIDATHLLGVLAHQVGRNDISISLIQHALSLKPEWPEAQSNLGNALKADGQLDQAISAFRRAIALQPDCVDAHNNLGNALREKSDFEGALAEFELAIQLKPDYAQAWNNLGNVLQETGRISQAIVAHRKAIFLSADYADAHNNLGVDLYDNGNLDESLTVLKHTIAISPRNATAYSNLGNTYKKLEQLDEAVDCYQQAISLEPNNAAAFSNLADALWQKGKCDAGLDACQKAISLNPNLPEARNNLGNLLRQQGKYDQAGDAYCKAIQLKPDYAEAYCNLGNALRDYGQFDGSLETFDTAISLKPDYARAHSGRGNVLKDLGQLDQALVAYRRAVGFDPANPEFHSNLVFSMNYMPGCSGEQISEELRRWDHQHGQPLSRLMRPHANDSDCHRRLRIGYVSPDFRKHVVGYNFFPLISHHDREQFEVFCYSQATCRDEMTQELQRLSSFWREIVGLSDQQVADQIRVDKIDILVDLTLHTGGNRLLVFAQKPAPVQVTFMGYPGSTGLTAIDYRLSDPYLDPPEMDESIYSEKTIRLPHSFWCYVPMHSSELSVSPLPALASKEFTFGCLNNFCKINDDVLKLWSGVLEQVENSRLLLLVPEGSHRMTTLEKFKGYGITPNRIEFVGAQTRQKYLQTYNRIDLGLDTFPYNGHTTSLDSFWMGVPVMSLVGKRCVARAGWSQLSNLGLTELSAESPEQFVLRAVQLAKDLPRLEHLRSTLRRRMEDSPLTNARQFSQNIEKAYRTMWHRWCKTTSDLQHQTTSD